jgi:hypothetical protein
MAQIRYLLIIAAVFAFAMVFSAFLGGQQTKTCLWALIVNSVAVCAGLVPVVLSTLYKPSLYTLSILAAGVIRLLITAVGAVIILVFVEVGVLWFVAWLGFFYLVVLGAEVYFTVRRLSRQNMLAAS